MARGCAASANVAIGQRAAPWAPARLALSPWELWARRADWSWWAGRGGSCFASGSPDSVSLLPQGAGLLCSPGFSAAAPEAWSSGLVLPRLLDELGKSLALTGASLPYLQGGNNETHLPELFLGLKAHSPQWAFRNAGWSGGGRPVTAATRPGDREKDRLGGRHWARHPYNGIRTEGWGGEAKEAEFQARSWGS